MPSLFTVLGRIMSGKPVFNPNDTSSQDGGQAPSSEAPTVPGTPTFTIQKGNANTYPVVRVKRVDTHISGSTTQVYCHILNASAVPLVLDKMQLFGTTQRLQDDLHPNEEREYLVYSGPVLQTDHQHEALLDYKTMSGDYFEAMYEIMYAFHQESKTFTVGELRLIPPIRDVYG